MAIPLSFCVTAALWLGGKSTAEDAEDRTAEVQHHYKPVATEAARDEVV